MLRLIVQRKAAMREANHARTMRRLSGEKRRATGRTSRRGAKRLSKQQAALRPIFANSACQSRDHKAKYIGLCRANADKRYWVGA